MKYCIANWKMNLTIEESVLFTEELQKKDLENHNTQIILCPSFISLKDVKKSFLNSEIQIGAQNMHHELEGPYTGEISVKMLKEIECEWVILGHSERRQYFNEEDIIINDKVNTVVENDLKPILCIGESLEQRNKNETFSVLEHQLSTALNKNNIENSHLIIAYEPVWAIGTGVSASINEISQSIKWIKEFLLEEFSLKIPILYGGSVSSSNCIDIGEIDGVDGFLIGTSSLDVEEFYKIYLNMNER
tara:strand:- start:1014 stop:1754 length:741 start_codon:yes stop_codon:yes gene_type:complete